MDNYIYSGLNDIATATAGLVLQLVTNTWGYIDRWLLGTGEVLACVQISHIKGN